jgi:hypothetical protein
MSQYIYTGCIFNTEFVKRKLMCSGTNGVCTMVLTFWWWQRIIISKYNSFKVCIIDILWDGLYIVG